MQIISANSQTSAAPEECPLGQKLIRHNSNAAGFSCPSFWGQGIRRFPITATEWTRLLGETTKSITLLVSPRLRRGSGSFLRHGAMAAMSRVFRCWSFLSTARESCRHPDWVRCRCRPEGWNARLTRAPSRIITSKSRTRDRTLPPSDNARSVKGSEGLQILHLAAARAQPQGKTDACEPRPRRLRKPRPRPPFRT